MEFGDSAGMSGPREKSAHRGLPVARLDGDDGLDDRVLRAVTLPVVLDKSCGQAIDDASTRKGLDRVLNLDIFRHIKQNEMYLDRI